jgi:hypothetical protein
MGIESFSPAGAAISAGLSVGGGLLGEAISAKDREKAMEQRANALSEMLGIPYAKAQEIAQSEIAKYQDDPETKAGIMGAFRKIQEKGMSMGPDEQERSHIYANQNRQRIENQREQAAIRNNAASRGIGGSGFSLANSAIAAQGGAGRAAQAGSDIAAEAERRAYGALGDTANLGRQINSDALNQAKLKADAITHANEFNAGAREREYANNVQRSKLRAGGYGQSADESEAEGERKRKLTSGMIEGAASGYKSGKNSGMW